MDRGDFEVVDTSSLMIRRDPIQTWVTLIFFTTGGFGDSSAPAVAATPCKTLELHILFYRFECTGKNEILFFNSL